MVVEVAPELWYGTRHMTVKLEVAPRTGKAASLRKAGNVPGIVYGPKQQPVAISVPKAVIEKTVREAGESTIIVLEGIGNPIEVLIHDVAFNAERGGVEHIDFYAIEAGKELTVNVPLEFVGDAPALKLGGSLTKVLHEVEVTCRPADLPQHIDVDISSLIDYEAQIHVSDLVLPKGVKLENEPEEVVALVQEAEEQVEEAAPVDMAAIEVEQKGKDDSPEA